MGNVTGNGTRWKREFLNIILAILAVAGLDLIYALIFSEVPLKSTGVKFHLAIVSTIPSDSSNPTTAGLFLCLRTRSQWHETLSYHLREGRSYLGPLTFEFRWSPDIHPRFREGLIDCKR